MLADEPAAIKNAVERALEEPTTVSVAVGIALPAVVAMDLDAVSVSPTGVIVDSDSGDVIQVSLHRIV